MGCGVPVVATTVGAFPELVIDCETGALIEPGDIAQMVEAAESYLNDSKKTKSHGENSLKHVHKYFSIEREANEILVVYVSVQNSS